MPTPPASTPRRQSPQIYEIRYTSDLYGRALHSDGYQTYDAATAARRQAVATALANGQRRLAESFEVI